MLFKLKFHSNLNSLQWKRIALSEPRTSQTKSCDENVRSGIKDVVADFEAQANQTIIDKYRSLKLLKQEMTTMKHHFNQQVLRLQEEKLEKCAILTEKIDKFRQNYKKLYPTNGNIDVEEFTEEVIYFDGKQFKVSIMPFIPTETFI